MLVKLRHLRERLAQETEARVLKLQHSDRRVFYAEYNAVLTLLAQAKLQACKRELRAVVLVYRNFGILGPSFVLRFLVFVLDHRLENLYNAGHIQHELRLAGGVQQI